MKVKLIKHESIGGSLEFAGTIVEVEQAEGEALIRKGIAELVVAETVAPSEDTQHG